LIRQASAACAIQGGVPVGAGHRDGSELRQPLGYAMVGGLRVSQVLTLFTTPVVYIEMDRLSHVLGRSHRVAASQAL
jgi:HAE1 family hydrophobic/amphiphilic exporter-1